MRENERLPLLAMIVHLLNDAGSWTGRMHIQKLVYLAQRLFGLSSDYEFVLYQRGPYSFGLDEDIRLLRSIGMLDIVPQPAPYGPTYVTTTSGDELTKREVLDKASKRRLEAMARIVGPKQTKELELLATTLYVTDEEELTSDAEIVRRVLELKPDFSDEEAQEAIKEVAQVREMVAKT